MSRQIQVNATGVQLPNGYPATDGQVVTLTDEQFSILDPKWFDDGTLTDQGEVADINALQVTIAAGKTNVVLPNGDTADAGDVSNLTLEQFTKIPAAWFPGTVVNSDDKLVIVDIPVELADITDVGTVFTVEPGFAGRLLDIDFIVAVPASTVSKAVTLTPSIAATLNAGGAVALTTANVTPAGAEVAGSAIVANRNEVQSVVATGGSAGDFTFTFTDPDGNVATTAAIDFDATAAEVDAALEALSNIGAGDVTCAGGPLPTTPVTITFTGALAAKEVAPLVVVDNITGGSAVITTTQTASRNVFTADEEISIVASAVTDFIEGEGVLHLRLIRT